jgi:serine/threonine-protein kinase RsbW
MTLELHATPDEVMRAVDALRDFACRCGADEREIFALALGLEECGSNVVNHALQRDPQLTFRVTLGQTGDAVVVELRDHGPAFDPVCAAIPERSEDAPAGGWGLPLVRRHLDEIHYHREGNENVLRLIKRLKAARGLPQIDLNQTQSE